MIDSSLLAVLLAVSSNMLRPFLDQLDGFSRCFEVNSCSRHTKLQNGNVTSTSVVTF